MGWGAGASQALPEVVNCFPHSRHLRGPSAMWIFRWAFRFPTCTQTGGQKASSPPPPKLWSWPSLGAPRGFHPSSGPVEKANALRICPPSFFPSLPCAAPRAHNLVELLVAVRALVLLVCVVRLQVAHLRRGVREGAAAVVALVGLLAAVHQLVPLEVARRGEELATVLAAVARLARVPLLVQVQQADEPVALATLLTAVGLQRAGGRVRRRRVAEGLSAGIQGGSGGGRGWPRGLPVRLLVGLAGGRVGEGLAALPARERLLTGVDADVPLEVPGVRELLPTVLRMQGAGSGAEPGGARGRAATTHGAPRTCG